MAGYTIPILVSGVPAIEAAVNAVRNLDRNTAALAQHQIKSANDVSTAVTRTTTALEAQVRAAKAARKEAVAVTPAGEKAPKMSAADKALTSLMKQVKSAEKAFKGFFTQLEFGYKQLRIENSRFNEELAKGSSALRISLNGKNALILATEKQTIANQNAKAAMESFNAAMYKETELYKLQLAEVQKSLLVTERRKVALVGLRNEYEYAVSLEGRLAERIKYEVAQAREAAVATDKRKTALANLRAELEYAKSWEGQLAAQTAYYVKQAKEAALADAKRAEAQRLLHALRDPNSVERQNVILERKIQLAKQEIATETKLAETNRMLAAVRRDGSVEQQTIIAERQLVAERALLTVRQDALNKMTMLKAQQTALTDTEKKEVAVIEEVNRLTAKRNTMLAQSDREVKKLNADLKAMVEAETRATVVTAKLSHHLNVMAQVAAASRAAIYGLGTSFGIYTSSTLLVAAAVFSMVSSLRTAVTTSLEFNKSLARLGAMSTEASVRGEAYAQVLTTLKTKALDMGRSTIFSMTESANAMTMLALAGLNAQQAIAAVGPTLKLATIGGLSAEKASDITTNVMMGFGKTVEDLPRIVDVLSKAATQSNSDVEQLGTAMSYAAPVAETFGISLEYTAGMMEVLANAGIKASRAGTGIRRMLLSLFAPTKAGVEAMEKLGMSVEGLSDLGGDLEALEKPIKGLMDTATDGTERLTQKLKELHIVTAGGTINVKAIKDITGVYGITAALQLLKSLDSGNKSVQAMYESLKDARGYADAQLDKVTAHIQATIEQIKSAAGVVGELGYESQMKAMDEISKSVLQYVRELSNSPAKIQAMIGVLKASAMAAFELVKALIAVKLTLMAIGIGTVAWGWLQKLLTYLPMAVLALDAMRRVALVVAAGVAMTATSFAGAAMAASTLAGMVKLLGAALWGLATNPVVLVLAGLTAAATAFYYYVVKDSEAVTGLQKAFEDLDNANVTDAKGMQKSVAGTLALITDTIDPLYKQRDLLEEQMKQYEGQNEKLDKLKASHQAITDQIGRQTAELQKQAGLDLSLNIAGLTKARDDLLKRQKETIATRLPESQQMLGGLARDIFPVSRKVAIRDAAELETYGIALAQVQSALDSNNSSLVIAAQLQAGLAAATDAERQLAFAEAAKTAGSAVEQTLQQIENITKEIDRATKQRNIPGGEERLTALIAYATQLREALKKANEEKDKLETMKQMSPTGVTVADIGKLAEENFAKADERLANLALSTEQLRDKEIRALEERKAKEVEVARATKVAWEAVYAATKDMAASVSDPVARAALIHNLEVFYNSAIAAANAQAETEEALKKAREASGKALDAEAKAMGKVIKSAAELHEANQALIKDIADFKRGFTELNEDILLKGSEVFADMTNHAKELSGALKEVTLSGAQVAGLKMPKEFTPAAGGRYSDLINAAGSKYGVDPELIRRVVGTESAYKPNAVSNKGAAGLMQIMPATAKELGIAIADRFVPEIAIDAGTRYLKEQLESSGGDVRLALAKYNAGPDAVKKYGGVPPYEETVNYVNKITKGYGGASLEDQNLSNIDQSKSITILVRDEEALARAKAAAAEQTKAQYDAQAHLDTLMQAEVSTYATAKDAYAEAAFWQAQLTADKELNVTQTAAATAAMEKANSTWKAYTAAHTASLAAEENSIRLGELKTIQVARSSAEIEKLKEEYVDGNAAMKDYNYSLAMNNFLLDKGALSMEQYTQNLSDAARKVAQSKGEYASFFDSLRYDAKSFEKIGTGAMSSFRDSIAEALASGKMDFEKFLTYLRDAAARFAADNIMAALFKPADDNGAGGGLLAGFVKIASKVITSYLTGGASVNDMVPVDAMAHGGAFRSSLPSGVYSSPTFFAHQTPGLHAFATGTGLLGEAGPEAVLPLTRVGGDLGVKAQPAGPAQINVTVNNLPGQAANVRQEGNSLSIDIIEQALASRIAKGGTPISKGLENSYAGMRRQGR